MGLERVLLVTTGAAPHKEIAEDPGAEVRLEMTRLTAEGEEATEAWAFEVENEGPSYTYLTLEALTEEKPDRELFLLLGADAAAGLASWKRPERIAELARIGVVPRAAVELDAVRSALDRFGAADRGEIIQMPLCGVSSTLIRERAAADRPLRHLVPDPVIELIGKWGLYR